MKRSSTLRNWAIPLATGVLFSLFSCASPKSHHLFSSAPRSICPYDAIIVPGIPFDSAKGKWGSLMKIRVYWSVHLYKQGITKSIIYSGSAVYSPYYEGKIMALYAEALGVPKEHIHIDTCAEHSTENVYYSYYVARKNGHNKIAIATDPFQSFFLRKFPQRINAPIDFLPISFKQMKTIEMKDVCINPEPAYHPTFLSLTERESFLKRWKGTRGKNIRLVPEDVRYDTCFASDVQTEKNLYFQKERRTSNNYRNFIH